MKYALERGHRDIAISASAPAIMGTIASTPDVAAPYHRLRPRARRVRAIAGRSGDPSAGMRVRCSGRVRGSTYAAAAAPSTDRDVTMADVIAIGVMQAARELGLRIPDDLSLIGYDDIEGSRLTCPPLTTIHQPTVEKGRVAAQLLLQRIEERSLAAEHIVLPVELVERESFRSIDAA